MEVRMTKKNVLLVGIALLGALSGLLRAQAVNARIVGSVQDEEDGAYLSGVTVIAVNTKTNAASTVISEKKEGAFRFLSLAPGNYQVSFELDGYHPYVASGIHLSAEQSFLLRVRLSRDKSYDQKQVGSGDDGGPDPRSRGIYAIPGRISIHGSAGCGYLLLGDSNDYLEHFGDRFRFVARYFDGMHTESELNLEVGYRITPRFELAVGMEWLRAGSSGNVFIGSNDHSNPSLGKEKFEVDLDVETLPLRLVGRYWLATGSGFLVSVHGGVLFNFSSWSMKTVHSLSSDAAGDDYALFAIENAEASGQGPGLLLGGRGELKVTRNLFLTVDFSGRYAPVGGFSGRSERHFASSGADVVTDGKLWLYESFEPALGKWLWQLQIGAEPQGPGARNVSGARVDHSGFSLKAGALLRF
jgi:hypothetical protein